MAKTEPAKTSASVRAALLATVLLNGESGPVHETWAQKRSRAENELASSGITREQKEHYTSILNPLIHSVVTPANYATDWAGLGESLFRNAQRGRQILSSAREDAWRLYLGIPQEHATFSVSAYRPSKSSDNAYYFKLEALNAHVQTTGVAPILVDIQLREQSTSYRQRHLTIDYQTGVMGAYSWSKGEDVAGSYVAYYDKWDLSHPLERIIGAPFEIYYRIYYDPKTRATVDPKPSIPEGQ